MSYLHCDYRVKSLKKFKTLQKEQTIVHSSNQSSPNRIEGYFASEKKFTVFYSQLKTRNFR